MVDDGLDLERGARTTLRTNASAFAYSIFITSCFGILDTAIGGTSVGRIFLFLIGATTAFALAETAVSRAFQDRFRPEPSDVVMLGSAMAMFSVSLAAGVAWGVTMLLGAAPGWFLAPFAGTLAYVAASSFEMALAKRRQDEDPPDREKQ